jgi:hypothetical protein
MAARKQWAPSFGATWGGPRPTRPTRGPRGGVGGAHEQRQRAPHEHQTGGRVPVDRLQVGVRPDAYQPESWAQVRIMLTLTRAASKERRSTRAKSTTSTTSTSLVPSHLSPPPNRPYSACAPAHCLLSLWCALSQGHTLVHFSFQLEPCLTHKNTLHTLHTLHTPLTWAVQPLHAPPIPCKALKLS